MIDILARLLKLSLARAANQATAAKPAKAKKSAPEKPLDFVLVMFYSAAHGPHWAIRGCAPVGGPPRRSLTMWIRMQRATDCACWLLLVGKQRADAAGRCRRMMTFCKIFFSRRLRKPTKANLGSRKAKVEANESQGGRPRKANQSQGRPMKANLSFGCWLLAGRGRRGERGFARHTRSAGRGDVHFCPGMSANVYECL
jgi:hypothetical protein